MAYFITSAQHLGGGGIASLSGENPSGMWTMSRAQVVAAIQSGERFLVEHPVGNYADVKVIFEGKSAYVATVRDATKLDNIGSLPRTE